MRWLTATARVVLMTVPAVFVPLARGQEFVPVAVPDIEAHVAFSTGASWMDHDGDGDLDLFVLTAFSANRDNVLYRNDGDDAFEAVLDSPLAHDAAQTVCGTWADYDNDGALDCFVSGLDVDHSILYRGLGSGAVEVETGAGIGSAAHKGTGCAWGDYDNDGYVDLVLAVLAGQLGMSGGNRLFHNNGDGTFAEVTNDPVVTTPDTHHHPSWADYDGDGDLDLFFAAGAVGSAVLDRLYRNMFIETGTGAFVPITTGVLATDARDSQTLSWADYDNDGDLDCYAINYTSVPNQLYRNDGAAFTKITSGAIVTDMGRAHGVAWGDYDNDGDLDVYVVRDQQQANRYYRNDGGGTFTSITTGPHVTDHLSSYGVAAGDYDADGDLDLFVPTARSEGPSILFRNDLAGGSHWLEVRCTGTAANRSAIGARVRARATIGGVPRWQMREIAASTGYGSQGPLEAHFGLGDAALVDSLVIEWPGGEAQVLTAIEVDRMMAVTEVLGPAWVGPGSAGDRGGRGPALAVAPNPISDRATLSFRIAHAGPVSLSVYDVTGRLVAVLAGGDRLDPGVHRFTLDGAHLPGSGFYGVRLVTDRGASTVRIVVSR